MEIGMEIGRETKRNRKILRHRNVSGTGNNNNNVLRVGIVRKVKGVRAVRAPNSDRTL